MGTDNPDNAGVGISTGDSPNLVAAGSLPTSVEIPSPTNTREIDEAVHLSRKGGEVANKYPSVAAVATVPPSATISTVAASTTQTLSRSKDDGTHTGTDTSLSTSTKDCETDEATKCSERSTNIPGSSQTSTEVAVAAHSSTNTTANDECTVKDLAIQLFRYNVEFEERPKQPMMFNRPFDASTCNDHFYIETSRHISSQSLNQSIGGSHDSNKLTLEEIMKYMDELHKMGPSKKQPYQDLCIQLGIKFGKSLKIQKLKDRIKDHLCGCKDKLLASSGSENITNRGTSPGNEQASRGEDAFNVFLTSYEIQPCLDFLCGNDGSITIPSLQFDYEKWNSNPIAATLHVKRYLSESYRRDPSRFKQSMSVDDIAPLLKQEDIECFQRNVASAAPDDPVNSVTVKEISNFLQSCVIRNKFNKAFTTAHKQKLQSIFELLDQWRLRNTGESVLLLGLGQVQMRFLHKDKDDNFVNGPPLEYILDIERVNEAIVLRPRKRTSCSINWEVESAMTSKNTSEEWGTRLRKKASSKAAEEIRPNVLSTFKDLLDLVASNARCSNISSSTNPIKNSGAEQLTKVVVTDAFCVYVKPMKPTTQSRDSRQLISALENGEREIHEPLRWLLSNVGYEPALNENVVDEDDICFPLPIDEIQRRTVVSLISGGCPVQVVEGPPGCGKTSVTANAASAAVAQKMTGLIVSPNKNALMASYDRLPKQVQEVTLNLSNLENGEKETTDSLEKLLDLIRGDKSDLYERLNSLKQRRLKIKAQLRNKVIEFKAHRSITHDLLTTMDGALQKMLESNLSITVPWLINGLLNGKIQDISRAITTLENSNPLDKKTITLIGRPENVLNEDVLKVAKKKLRESQDPGSSPSLSLGTLSEPENNLLEGIEINNRMPSSYSDWQDVVQFIEFRMLRSKFLDCGCPENLFTTPESRSTLIIFLRDVSNFSTLLKKFGKDIEKLVYKAEKMGTSHKGYCDLTKSLQAVEANLVGLQVKETLIERIDADGINTLQTALHVLERSTGEEREADFQNLLRKILKYFPLIILRLDQVPKFLPPDESRDLGIIDESSQASCVAVNFLARVKASLIVGDNNQVNPQNVGLSQHLMRLLQRSTPDIPGRVQLGPNYSFMHLASATYYKAVRYLLYHYRCTPEIIAICNKIFYKGRLIPLRPANINDKAIHAIRVQGTRQDNGVNEAEAEKTASIMFVIIVEAKDKSNPPTIAVSVATGQEAALQQCRRIQELLTKKLQVVGLNYRTCEKRHHILMGSASRMQGNERNISFINFVNSPKKKNGGGLSLLTRTSVDQRKEYNVMCSRASDREYLIYSFGPEDLHKDDVRQEIFECLHEPVVDSTNGLSAFNSDMVDEDEPFFDFFMSKIAEELTKHGYTAQRIRNSPLWSNGWRVDVAGRADGSNCVYLHPEHYGESEKEWDKMFDQQIALERAGRKCLRIDSLTASLNFPKTKTDILDFLKNQGLSINGKELQEAQKESTSESPSRTHLHQPHTAAELADKGDGAQGVDRTTEPQVTEMEEETSAKRNALDTLATDNDVKKQKVAG